MGSMSKGATIVPMNDGDGVLQGVEMLVCCRGDLLYDHRQLAGDEAIEASRDSRKDSVAVGTTSDWDWGESRPLEAFEGLRRPQAVGAASL